MRKKRILFSSEASYIPSGFGVYYKEVISRLMKTQKYEIAEFGGFGYVNHPNDESIKWRFYANAVQEGDPRYDEYNAKHKNKHGLWRFERVLLDFKPDIVVNIKDPFMFDHERMSGLRDFYAWVICPTVDSMPQQEDWIDLFVDADAVFTYSNYGFNSLKNLNADINLIDNNYPGVSKELSPINDKQKLRSQIGIPVDAKVIGTVMRNQSRKLYADLFEAFSKLIQQPNMENTYLYCHTGFPDLKPWNIPKLLGEHNIENMVYFTYMCTGCDKIFAYKFKNNITYCPFCQKETACLPTIGNGIKREDLRQVYNLFDVYVQYSVAEGAGFPTIEAAGCGVPVCGTDYSATSDIVRELGGFPIPVKRMFRDSDMDANRALPDNDEFVKYMIEFFSLPKQLRMKKGFETRKLAEKTFSWDLNAKKWEKFFDDFELTGLQGKWDAPPRPIRQEVEISQELSNTDYVRTIILEIMQEPRFLNTFFEHGMVSGLNYKSTVSGGTIQPFSREKVLEFAKNVLNAKIYIERLRTNKDRDNGVKEDYLDYAEIKEMLHKEMYQKDSEI